MFEGIERKATGTDEIDLDSANQPGVLIHAMEDRIPGDVINGSGSIDISGISLSPDSGGIYFCPSQVDAIRLQDQPVKIRRALVFNEDVDAKLLGFRGLVRKVKSIIGSEALLVIRDLQFFMSIPRNQVVLSYNKTAKVFAVPNSFYGGCTCDICTRQRAQASVIDHRLQGLPYEQVKINDSTFKGYLIQ